MGLFLGLCGSLSLLHVDQLLQQHWDFLRTSVSVLPPPLVCLLSVLSFMSVDITSFFVLLFCLPTLERGDNIALVCALLCLVFVTAVLLGAILFYFPLLGGAFSFLQVGFIAFICFGLNNLKPENAFETILLLIISPGVLMISAILHDKLFIHNLFPTILLYVTLMLNSLVCAAYENVSYYVKVSVLVNVLLPLQFFIGGRKQSSEQAFVCVGLSVCALLLLFFLVKAQAVLSVGASVGAAAAVLGVYRAATITASHWDREDERQAHTVGAVIGAILAFTFY